MKRSWKRDVCELESRLARCHKLLEHQFPDTTEKPIEEGTMSGNHTVEKVVRDKNTIVEITVHTKPKQTDRKSSDQSRQLTSKVSSHPPTRSPRRAKRAAAQHHQRETLPQRTASQSQDRSERSVPVLLRELKEVISTSGIKDVYEFLQEIDGEDRRKSAPEIGRKSGKDTTASAETKRAERKTAPLYAKSEPENNQHEKELIEERRRSNEAALKLRNEIARYKKEYDNGQVQLKIARETNEDLKGQVVEMKQLITKLTANNRTLVQLMTERSSQDEKLNEVENQNRNLRKQLETERDTITCFQTKFREQEEEIIRLKTLTVDIRTQLQHGLEGLEQPRPGSTLPPSLLDKTRDILGQTLNDINSVHHRGPPKGAPAHGRRPLSSASTDSAIDDPASMATESRSLQAKPGSTTSKQAAAVKPVFMVPPPPRDPPPRASTQGNGNLGQQVTVGTPSTQPPPSSNSSLHQPPDRLGSALPGRASPARVPPRGGAAPLPAFYSHSPPTRQVSGGSEQLPAAALHSSSRTLFPQNSRSQSSRSQRSSLMTSLLQPAAGHQLQEDRFTPANLDLEETGEAVNETDGSLAKSKDTPVTVIEGVKAVVEEDQTTYFAPRPMVGVKVGGEKADKDGKGNRSDSSDVDFSKGTLENKVQDFLDRLHQESLNYSLPQANSFQGPSFHLSMSGEEEGLNISSGTTLTEGRFRKGLETSIEVLPQEFHAN